MMTEDYVVIDGIPEYKYEIGNISYGNELIIELVNSHIKNVILNFGTDIIYFRLMEEECDWVIFIATVLTLSFLGIYPIILLIAIIPSFIFGVVGFKKMISKGFSNSTKQVNMGIISPIYVVFSLCF